MNKQLEFIQYKFRCDFNIVGKGAVSSDKVRVYQRFLGRLVPAKIKLDWNDDDAMPFAMQVIEAPRRMIQRSVNSVLDIVGLRDKYRCFPNQLSGGEQQRVAIARAIVNNPAIVIADEPTGNLDPETSWGIMDIFQRINSSGTTIVMATHDKTIVDAMQRRVIAIENGRIVRDESHGGYGYED